MVDGTSAIDREPVRASRGGDALLAATLACAASALVAAFAPLRGSAASTAIATLSLLLAPGLILVAALRLAPACRSLAGALALAAALGSGVAFPAAGLARALGLPLDVGARALAALSIASLVALALAWRGGALRGFDGLRGRARADVAADALVAAASFALVAIYVRWIEPTLRSGDLWTYLSYIDWMVHAPGEVYVAHTADPEEVNARLLASPFLAFEAMVTALVLREGSSLEVFWTWLPITAIPLAIAAPQALADALRLRAATRVALVLAHVALVLGTLPYLLESGTAGLRWPGPVLFFRITQDKVYLAYVLVPVAASMAVAWMRSRDWRWLVALAVVGAGCVVTHPLGLPFLAMAALPYAAATALAQRDGAPFASRARAALAVALAIAPLAAWPLSQRAEEGAPTTLADVAGFERRAHLVVDSLSIASREENRFTASPMLIEHPLLVAGIACALVCGLALRANDAARYVFALATAILAMLYVPGIPPLAGRIVTPYLLWRFTWLLPSALAIAVAGALAVDLARRRAGSRAWVPWAAGLAFACALAAATSLPRDLARLPETFGALAPAPFDTRTSRELVAGIRELVGSEEAVLLDPTIQPLALSLAPGMQTIFWRWGSNNELYDRIVAFCIARMIEPRHIGLLREQRVGWIAVRRVLPVVDALRERPDVFEPVGASLSVEVFRVRNLAAASAPIDAVAHWTAAAAADPSSFAAASSLGLALLLEGRPVEAIPALERAIALDPTSAVAHERLGTSLLLAGDGARAVLHLARSLELDAARLDAANNLVWLLATSPDPGVRDPQRAARIAARAFESGDLDGATLDTLAAAQAASGDFESAIRSAVRAVDLYVSNGASSEALAPIRARLELYRRGVPFVDGVDASAGDAQPQLGEAPRTAPARDIPAR